MPDSDNDPDIETGADTLLEFLEQKSRYSVSQISEDLGIPEDRVERWAKALEDSGLVEIDYSAIKGMVLEYASNKTVDELNRGRHELSLDTDTVEINVEEIEEAEEAGEQSESEAGFVEKEEEEEKESKEIEEDETREKETTPEEEETTGEKESQEEGQAESGDKSEDVGESGQETLSVDEADISDSSETGSTASSEDSGDVEKEEEEEKESKEIEEDETREKETTPEEEETTGEKESQEEGQAESGDKSEDVGESGQETLSVDEADISDSSETGSTASSEDSGDVEISEKEDSDGGPGVTMRAKKAMLNKIRGEKESGGGSAAKSSDRRGNTSEEGGSSSSSELAEDIDSGLSHVKNKSSGKYSSREDVDWNPGDNIPEINENIKELSDLLLDQEVDDEEVYDRIDYQTELLKEKLKDKPLEEREDEEELREDIVDTIDVLNEKIEKSEAQKSRIKSLINTLKELLAKIAHALGIQKVDNDDRS
ncbi:MAG: hypothetical protein ABEJ99_01745 [Candidatus Nanohaloarchaea archaeon]